MKAISLIIITVLITMVIIKGLSYTVEKVKGGVDNTANVVRDAKDFVGTKI
jgi:hypothetical protein